MIYKNTTLGQSELVAMDKIQNFSTLKSRKSPKPTDKKDAKYDLNLVKKFIDTGISLEAKAKFPELISEFFDVFSKNEWDIGQCNVTAHKMSIEPCSDQSNSLTEGYPSTTNKTYKKKLMPFWKRNLSRLVIIARTVHQPCSSRRKAANSA